MAFTTALSGVNAAQADLDVISNNIANSSTTGFKTARAEFGDVYAQSLLGTTTPTPGQGVKVTGITQQFSQGDLAFTDNALDVAINGDGFFQVKNGWCGGIHSRRCLQNRQRRFLIERVWR
jgi:flagellar hook protein FlgE